MCALPLRGPGLARLCLEDTEGLGRLGRRAARAEGGAKGCVMVVLGRRQIRERSVDDDLLVSTDHCWSACPSPSKQKLCSRCPGNQEPGNLGEEKGKERAGMPLDRMSSRFCGVQQAQEAHSTGGSRCQCSPPGTCEMIAYSMRGPCSPLTGTRGPVRPRHPSTQPARRRSTGPELPKGA